jgi:hypothetical protein
MNKKWATCFQVADDPVGKGEIQTLLEIVHPMQSVLVNTWGAAEDVSILTALTASGTVTCV